MLYCFFYLIINVVFYGYIISIFCDCNIFYCVINNKGGGGFLFMYYLYIFSIRKLIVI